MTALTQQDYLDAQAVQSACNLSGVVFSFAQVMEKLCFDPSVAGSTQKRNTHPICRLYAEQLLFLSGGGCGDPESYRQPSEAVRQQIAQAQDQAPQQTENHEQP